MKVSIVVLAYGDAAMTNRCLASIFDDVDLIVVDNGSDGYVESTYRASVNLGFAGGCNMGARLADGDVVVFLNNDTVVREGWLEALLRPFEEPDVGITGATLRYPSGAVQSAGITVDFDRGVGQEAMNADLPPGDVDAVCGAALAIRSDLFDALGGFDEGYWNGYEDVDLCLKARDRGWRVVLTDAEVEHLESASGPERWTRVRQNIDRLRMKWS